MHRSQHNDYVYESWLALNSFAQYPLATSWFLQVLNLVYTQFSFCPSKVVNVKLSITEVCITPLLYIYTLFFDTFHDAYNSACRF